MRYKQKINSGLVLVALFWILNSCTAKTSTSNSPVHLNLMTFNIRYDNPADSANNWKFRREFAANMINQNDVDVMGTQEVLNTQLTDILALLPHFAYAGVGRKDGQTAGEYSAVFYKKERFELMNSGTFWLSENPGAIGIKGWDAAIERIVTWVILKDRATGREFAFINTHFDHIGQVARRESAKLLLSKVDEIAKGRPVFVSGDLNASPDSEVVQILTDTNTTNHLTNSRSVAASITGPAWTFHGFGSVPVESRTIIDYIFIKNKIAVQQLSVISEMLGKLYLSDHNPILIKASF
jgi:endonuclease/exonuclease/phosphatase family metal-dependent hydrolase